MRKMIFTSTYVEKRKKILFVFFFNWNYILSYIIVVVQEKYSEIVVEGPEDLKNILY